MGLGRRTLWPRPGSSLNTREVKFLMVGPTDRRLRPTDNQEEVKGPSHSLSRGVEGYPLLGSENCRERDSFEK